MGGATNKKRWLYAYLGFALIHLLYKYAVMAVGLTGFADLLLTYPSPLVVGESVCLFLYFKEAFAGIPEKAVWGKLIRFAAPGIYSVYVIHVHPKVFWNSHIIALFRAWDDWSVLAVCAAMIGTAAALFAVCVCLDALRQRLFRVTEVDRTVDRLSNHIENKVRTLLGD